nr:MAG TPA: hypothetical protein [Caudoviricetes sp.]
MRAGDFYFISKIKKCGQMCGQSKNKTAQIVYPSRLFWRRRRDSNPAQ